MTVKTVTTETTADEVQGTTQKVPFGILTQFIKDQSFENPNPVEAFLTQHEKQPEISVNVSARATKVKDSLYEVTLDLKTKATLSEKQPLFIAELAYSALVTLDETQLPQESIAPLLMIHTPTMIFPFARAILSDMTREGGFPALVLHPVDFAALFQAQAEEQKKAAS